MKNFRIDYQYTERNGAVFNKTEHNWFIQKAESIEEAKKVFTAEFKNAEKRELKIKSVEQV